MEGWITSEDLMAEKEEPEGDMLAELLGKDSKDVFDCLMDILGDDEPSCCTLTSQ
jgi:hypothetical protein